MSRSRDLANLGDEATGGITVSDISDISSTYLTQSSASSTYQTVTNSDKLAHQSVPHIIPRYLHPAVEGKSNSGVDLKALVTAGSYSWGDVYSGDNLRYFYTDIKGSRKIHDPRVGSHFGSQRYKIKSKQLVEQETATHGQNIFTIDGREWMRGCGNIIDVNDSSGQRLYIYDSASPFSFIEITGYFSDINVIGYTEKDFGRGFTTTLDGGTASGENTSFQTNADSPLDGRYVDAGSNVNLGLGATLGIHTLKITSFSTSEYPNFYGIELIAQTPKILQQLMPQIFLQLQVTH